MKATSKMGPDPSKKFVMNNGVAIPLGKNIDLIKNKVDTSVTTSPEYIVYDATQIRMRYLIQIEEEN